MNFTSLAACSSPSPIQISQSGKGAYEASLAVDDTGFTVGWYDVRDGNAEIYMRRLGPDGRPAGPERRLTETSAASYEVGLQNLGQDIVVAWYEQSPGGEQSAMLGLWNREGAQKWLDSFPAGSRNPVIRTDERNIFCAWVQAGVDSSEAVWAGWWSGDGQQLRAPVRLGAASKNTWNVNAALDRSGDAWVVFDAVASTRSNEVFLARVGPSGTRLERLSRDDGIASKYPDLAFADEGRVALTWYDERDGNEEVYLLVSDPTELRGEIDQRARRVTDTPGESVGAYVAWNRDRLGLAWSDKVGGASGQHEIHLQVFDREGAALGRATRITRNDTWSLVPAIRPFREGFALAWNEFMPGSAALHDGTSEVSFTLVP